MRKIFRNVWKGAVAGLTLATIWSGSATAGTLSGRVVDISDGAPLPRVAVTTTYADGAPGPHAVTVFTDEDGTYRFPESLASEDEVASVAVRKLGFRALPSEVPGTYYMEPAANIAGQVPASAWMGIGPAGDERNITVTSCSSCHQVASPKMREYAAQIEAVRGGPEGDKAALEAWRRVVRHEAWRTIVKYMRSMHYAVFPLESKMSIGAIDWPTAQNDALNFFNDEQGEIVAQYLTDHFPRTTAYLPQEGYRREAPLGVTSATVIREYALPDDALVRELVPAPGSRFLWGADVKRNVIVRLDPEDGTTKWYPVDFDGSTGPHTIVADDSGDIWVSMVDNDQFGRFEPDTEKWTLWTLRPSNLPDADSIAGAAIVHDMSIDSHGRLARDRFDKVWLTIVGTNQMGTLDTETGDVAFYDTNQVGDLSPINHLLYSTVLTPDGTCAWYSQVNGHVGCINTATKERDKLIEFPEGAGPRRMARDDDGTLWVALFGSGQVARIDMESATVTATYDLPDRASAPYAVTWDERREAVWVANANSDAIDRIDAATGRITTYPLPRRMAYLRKVEVDDQGRLVATYGNYPEGSGPSMGVLIDVGD
ncbi:MAG: carboxypeptidase regulatory-like domain-containing protein [Parvibaculaceae bacterium]